MKHLLHGGLPHVGVQVPHLLHGSLHSVARLALWVRREGVLAGRLPLRGRGACVGLQNGHVHSLCRSGLIPRDLSLDPRSLRDVRGDRSLHRPRRSGLHLHKHRSSLCVLRGGSCLASVRRQSLRSIRGLCRLQAPLLLRVLLQLLLQLLLLQLLQLLLLQLLLQQLLLQQLLLQLLLLLLLVLLLLLHMLLHVILHALLRVQLHLRLQLLQSRWVLRT